MKIHADSPLRAVILDDWASVEALADEWRTLLESSAANSVFLTPEWILSWREAMQGAAVKPAVVTVRNAHQRLLGLGLFYIATQHLFTVIPYRVLRTMGDHASGGVYPDIIADPCCADDVCSLVASSISQLPIDAFWLPHISGETGARERVRKLASHAGWHVEEREEEFYCIDLPASFDDYEKTLSSATRKDLRRAARKLIDDDGANLRSCEELAELDAMLDTLIAMNTKRWKGTAGGGVFQRKPREAAFYRTFTKKALARGWLRFMQLNADGTPAALEIGYRYGDRYYALQGCYDLEGPPGTGKVLLVQMLKRIIEEGARKFDLLSGDFSYKQRYGADVTPMSEFFLSRRSLRTLPLRLLGFWPRGRYMDFRKIPGIDKPANAIGA